MEAGPLGQPVADERNLVGPVTLQNEVDRELLEYMGVNGVEEFTKLNRAMATMTLADAPMPCSSTRLRHNCTVGRLTCNCAAIAALSCPARAAKIIRQRSATCCGVPCEASHCFSCVCSAAPNLIARLVFGTTRIIAIKRPQSYL